VKGKEKSKGRERKKGKERGRDLPDKMSNCFQCA